ncbi:hypothetical protein NVP1052A_52 [Vibrio phage 1.052.A._10N.286.46.C3]|nr:hypothetical protein NVP1052A_52 [Vibrio phage 1.052.A._10N.286.46.C3]
MKKIILSAAIVALSFSAAVSADDKYKGHTSSEWAEFMAVASSCSLFMKKEGNSIASDNFMNMGVKAFVELSEWGGDGYVSDLMQKARKVTVFPLTCYEILDQQGWVK